MRGAAICPVGPGQRRSRPDWGGAGASRAQFFPDSGRGAIEGNGDGLLVTTESVLLNPNRNPDWSRAMIEEELKRMLGVRAVFWLGSGIEGDDTDYHIDDMVRFVCRDAVVSIVETDSSSPHYRALAENNERLQDLRCVDGSGVEVIPLPMPDPSMRRTGAWISSLPVTPISSLLMRPSLFPYSTSPGMTIAPWAFCVNVSAENR